MFYSHEILQRKGGKFAIIWLAATTSQDRILRLSRRDYCSINVVKTCEDIITYIDVRAPRPHADAPRPRFSLYLSSQLMYGTVRVHWKQATFLLSDVRNLSVSFCGRPGVLKNIDLLPMTTSTDIPDAQPKMVPSPRTRDRRSAHDEAIEEALEVGRIAIDLEEPLGYMLESSLELPEWEYMQGLDTEKEAFEMELDTSPVKHKKSLSQEQIPGEHTVPAEQITMKEVHSPLRKEQVAPEDDLQGEVSKELLEGYAEGNLYHPEQPQPTGQDKLSSLDEVSFAAPDQKTSSTDQDKTLTDVSHGEDGELRPKKKRPTKKVQKGEADKSPTEDEKQVAAGAPQEVVIEAEEQPSKEDPDYRLQSPKVVTVQEQELLLPKTEETPARPPEGPVDGGRPKKHKERTPGVTPDADQKQPKPKRRKIEVGPLNLSPIDELPDLRRRRKRRLLVDDEIILPRSHIKKNLQEGHETSVPFQLPDPKADIHSLGHLMNNPATGMGHHPRLLRLWKRNAVTTEQVLDEDERQNIWSISYLQKGSSSSSSSEMSTMSPRRLEDYSSIMELDSVERGRVASRDESGLHVSSLTASLLGSRSRQASMTHESVQEEDRFLLKDLMEEREVPPVPEEVQQPTTEVPMPEVEPTLPQPTMQQPEEQREAHSPSQLTATGTAQLLDRLAGLGPNEWVAFSWICPPKHSEQPATRTQAANAFCTILQFLKSQKLDVHQEEPYAEIYISKTFAW